MPRDDARNRRGGAGDGGGRAAAHALPAPRGEQRRVDPRAPGRGGERAHAPHDLHAGLAADLVRARTHIHCSGEPSIQSGFAAVYGLVYLLSPRIAHRIVGYLEEEAVHSYTQYLKEIDEGRIANVPAPQIAIDYWQLPQDATLYDVVLSVRADEAHHRDVNHYAALPQDATLYDVVLSVRADEAHHRDVNHYAAPQRPPCFDPSQRGDPTVQSWVFTMNVFFDANYVESDAAKIRYAVSLLRGLAMDWCRHLEFILRDSPVQHVGCEVRRASGAFRADCGFDFGVSEAAHLAVARIGSRLHERFSRIMRTSWLYARSGVGGPLRRRAKAGHLARNHDTQALEFQTRSSRSPRKSTSYDDRDRGPTTDNVLEDQSSTPPYTPLRRMQLPHRLRGAALLATGRAIARVNAQRS
ncbi:unnamed protein product [Closterium sp. NIES-54]